MPGGTSFLLRSPWPGLVLLPLCLFFLFLHLLLLAFGHVSLRHTVLYLHLSQRHLQAVANPLDALPVSAPDTAPRSRLKRRP